MPPAVATATALPARLGKYEILTPLASGGMARIYVGRSTGIGSFERHVVLKMILPERQHDETAVQMFLDEARLAASLNHQNVAQVFEVGEDAGIHFLAMEYVHGQDLRALLARAGSQGTRVPLELALTVVAGAAAGLHHAHERRASDGTPMGIVHRDVSPSNLMIGYDGSVKLLDFGIAKAAARSVETQSGVIKGKFAYMAPEQCRGREVDARSDVFSLGIILYEVTTQHRCFRADSDFDTMHRIVTGDVVRPSRLIPSYPPALELVVMRALSVDPAQRYQSAGLLLEAIEGFATAARTPLSTMALGRFMREIFGEVPEPWLNSARLGHQAAKPNEHTVSSTAGGDRGRPPSSPPTSPSGSMIRRPASQRLASTMAAPLPVVPAPPPPTSSHDEAPMHLPADALELAAPLVEDAVSVPGRRSRAHGPASGFATASATAVQAEPRQTMPGIAPTPTPLPAPVDRASGLAGGSQPIPPPRPFAARATSSSAPPLGATRQDVLPQVAPRPGYAAAAPPPRRSSQRHHEAPYLPPPTATIVEPPHPTGAHRGLYMACGMALVGIIAMLVMTIASGDEPSPPAAAPPASVAPPRAAAPAPSPRDPAAPPRAPAQASNPTDAAHARPGSATIKIHVVSLPPAAEVRIAGTPVGATPLDIELPRKAGRATLTLHHARFQDATASVDLDTDYSAEFKLTATDEPRPVPRPAPVAPKRPAPAPAPKRTCQPPDRYNPYDDSCGGKPCPRC